MKNKIEIVKNMGLSWTLYRTKYEIEKKLGLLKKNYQSFLYEDVDLSNIMDRPNTLKELIKSSLVNSFFSPDFDKLHRMRSELRLEESIKLADDILKNKFVYFSKHIVKLDSLEWHYSPFTKKFSPNDMHWTEIGDLSSDFGDIKWIWELSRFSFVYPLSRAYAITKDEKYAIAYWEMFEDFIEHNPPELGANYKCGQEMSLRIMAWTFGLNIFIDSPQTTEERLELLTKAIHHHANHVEKHFDFALKSVKNNHSLSEAAGMYTAGVIFQFLNSSAQWRLKGHKFIQSEANWQIYPDGSYIQHSFNYQRLAIQDLTWFLKLAQLNNDNCSPSFVAKFKKTIEFMYQFQEPSTGRVPNYGMNDGAYIHPLTSKEYLDHRPALQAAWLTVTGERLYEENDVDEIALWLGLQTTIELNNPTKKSAFFTKGGYGVLRNQKQFAMVRCASYKHRPVQADMLHVDFWDGEYNILADAGTFSYNTSLKESLYFNGTASHNTLMINGKDQMKKASRFIWLNWTKSKMLSFQQTDLYSLFEGEHYGYGDITHRRGLIQAKDTLIIIDDVIGIDRETNVSLSWLFGIENVQETSHGELLLRLPDGHEWTMYSLNQQTKSFLLECGSENPIAGWQSLYYGHKRPMPQLIANSTVSESTRYITILQKNKKKEVTNSSESTIEIGNKTIVLKPIGEKTIFVDRELW
ncbi:alginate lyase family protein [Planococcus dechangensis]|uniref:Alginate lyase family protein n=1 Tax=Planococcus dechangensis TaxID=1176255 RepID=A0ABV9MCN6_9BACL